MQCSTVEYNPVQTVGIPRAHGPGNNRQYNLYNYTTRGCTYITSSAKGDKLLLYDSMTVY